MPLYCDARSAEKNAELSKAFQEALQRSTDNEQAVKYLKDLNFTEEAIESFTIGWFPENVTSKRMDLSRLEPLRGRIVFPIVDEFGDVISFSGRLPYKDTGDVLKWWHESYTKAFFMYGLNTALPHILKKDYVILVEGQTDVISCYLNGMKNTVGTMGTALTDQHIAKLLRSTNNFVLMFDGDSAGRKISKETKNKLKIWTEKSAGAYKYNSYDIPLKYKGETYDPHDFILKFGPELLHKNIDLKLNKSKNNVV